MKIENSEGLNNGRKRISRDRRNMWSETKQTALFHNFAVFMQICRKKVAKGLTKTVVLNAI